MGQECGLVQLGFVLRGPEGKMRGGGGGEEKKNKKKNEAAVEQQPSSLSRTLVEYDVFKL